MKWRILWRARLVATKESQSREGVWLGAVRISTMSPLESVVRSGTSLPLIRAPTQRCPTSVCTRYAKSTGVAPLGKAKTSPFGVNV